MYSYLNSIVLFFQCVLKALLKLAAASTPEEIKEVEEGVTDFLRRVRTNAKIYKKKTD
jgi:hypothetical protein